MIEVYKFADTTFEINSIYEMIHKMCKEYKTEERAVHKIGITQNDILFEKKKSELEDIKEGIKIRHFSAEYLETLAVYRKIAELMVDNNTILLHGSVIAVDGEGYLFTAKSGTGKSTHTRLWRKMFGNRAVMVNDDKTAITYYRGWCSRLRNTMGRKTST